MLSLSQVPSARLCRRLCDENPNCNFFTWYSLTDSQSAQSGGDVFGHICFHHQDCAQLDFKCRNCHSGPRSDHCPNNRARHRRTGRKWVPKWNFKTRWQNIREKAKPKIEATNVKYTHIYCSFRHGVEELWVYYYIILTVIGYLLDLELTYFMLGTFWFMFRNRTWKTSAESKTRTRTPNPTKYTYSRKICKNRLFSEVHCYPKPNLELSEPWVRPSRSTFWTSQTRFIHLPSLVTTFTFLA